MEWGDGSGFGQNRLRDGNGNPFRRPPPKRLECTARPRLQEGIAPTPSDQVELANEKKRQSRLSRQKQGIKKSGTIC